MEKQCMLKLWNLLPEVITYVKMLVTDGIFMDSENVTVVLGSEK